MAETAQEEAFVLMGLIQISLTLLQKILKLVLYYIIYSIHNIEW